MSDFQQKAFIGLEAVMFIACQNTAIPVRSKDICNALGFSQRYLEQILQILVKEKILRGIRGPNGGYVLAKERRKIVLREILSPLMKEQDNKNTFSTPFTAILLPLKERAKEGMLETCGRITLQEVCESVEKSRGFVATSSNPLQKPDFTI